MSYHIMRYNKEAGRTEEVKVIEDYDAAWAAIRANNRGLPDGGDFWSISIVGSQGTLIPLIGTVCLPADPVARALLGPGPTPLELIMRADTVIRMQHLNKAMGRPLANLPDPVEIPRKKG